MTLSLPLVSIIIPLYNAEKYLKIALDSCLNQTYTHIEVILIDDGSQDKTSEICKEYLKYDHFKYYKNDENKGLIYSLNKAIGLSSGDYIARMDQDDICFPDRIKKQMEYLDANPSVQALGTDVVLISGTGVILGKPRQLLDDESAIQWSIISSCPLHHPTVIFRRKILNYKLISTEPYSSTQHAAEDLDLWARMILSEIRINVLKTPLLFYRKHGTSMSSVYKSSQLETSIMIAVNFSEQKWGVKLSHNFVTTIRSRNLKGNEAFFTEAMSIIKELKLKKFSDISASITIDLQQLCLEQIHFHFLTRIKQNIAAISYILTSTSLKTTPIALFRFYRGLVRRFLFSK